MPKRPVWTPEMIKTPGETAKTAVRRLPGIGRGRRRRQVSVDGPDPVDVHVGARVRERRVMMGLSQTTLATKIGLTFQQVQKYERGANRVSASMMWRMGEVLDVPISYFFDGLERNEPAGQPDQWDPAVLRLARRIRTLPLAVRNSLASLVGSLVNDSDDDADVEIIDDELAAEA